MLFRKMKEAKAKENEKRILKEELESAKKIAKEYGEYFQTALRKTDLSTVDWPKVYMTKKQFLKKLFACERICNKMDIYTYEISEGDTICIMNGAMESYNKSASAWYGLDDFNKKYAAEHVHEGMANDTFAVALLATFKYSTEECVSLCKKIDNFDLELAS